MQLLSDKSVDNQRKDLPTETRQLAHVKTSCLDILRENIVIYHLVHQQGSENCVDYTETKIFLSKPPSFLNQVSWALAVIEEKQKKVKTCRFFLKKM